jgi:hypothetical protein
MFSFEVLFVLLQEQYKFIIGIQRNYKKKKKKQQNPTTMG